MTEDRRQRTEDRGQKTEGKGQRAVLCLLPSVICSMLLFSGCAGWGNVKSTLTLPDGRVYTAYGKSDEVIEYKDGETSISFNRQGRPGMIEQALGIMFMNLPDVELKKE